MKLLFFIITLSVIFISCNKEKTVYNGYIKNDTSGELTFKIIADSAVADSFNITSKSSKLIVTYEEEGDFEIFESWGDISEVKNFDSMPQSLKLYIQFIEEYLQIPIKIISIGPERNQTIIR